MITRDNYEEFFLLYVDNELSAADRQTVDEFVAENPDLKIELTTWMGCRLQPENEVFFEDRDSLLKRDASSLEKKVSPIDPAHYSGWFLSYVDGELNEGDRLAVEEFVLAHPSLHKELTLLQQTASIPEPAIVFENKASLYRKEKTRKILYLPLFRMGAAATLLGAIGLLTFLLLRKNNSQPIAYHTDMRQEKDSKKIQPPVTQRTGDPLYPYAAGREEKRGTAQPTRERTARSADQENKSAVQRKRIPVEVQERLEPAREKEGLPVAKAGIDGSRNKSGINAVHTRPTEPLATENSKQVQIIVSNSGLLADAGSRALIKAPPPLIASSGPIISEEDELDMGPSSPKKNKFRGFFRKVSRTFEKTASRNEDEGQHGLLVGNLQIALK